MSIHANVRMSKTIIIKVGVRTYLMYAKCRTLSSSLNPLTNFTSSSRSTKFKDIPHQNIFQMVTKTVPISTRVVISYAMKWDILFWVYWKVNGNWENNISISQWRDTIVEQILAPEEINQPKRSQLWESQSGIWVGKLTIWVRSFEFITE